MARKNVYEVGKELRNYLNNTLLKKSFLSAGQIGESELVDITNNYGWTAKPLNGSIKDNKTLGQNQFTHQIPFAMAFERKQTINSTIRNIAQSLTIGTDLFNLVKNESNKAHVGDQISATLSSVVESAQNAIETPQNYSTPNIDKALSYTNSAIKTLMSYVKEAYNTVGRIDEHLNTSFLYPYSFMYMTEPTGFQFVFPMLTDGADYFSVTNTWSNGDKANGNNNARGGTSDLINNFVTNWMETAVGIGASLYVDIQNLRDALNFSDKTIQDYFIEKAKFYNYSTDGQKVKIRFALYNTTQKDIWKKHYNFLYLFALRNLPFKFTPSSFSPPLLYDIFLPGSKYLPLCYVSNFNVTNQGVTRRLTTDSILKQGSKVQVSVPDAWVIDLDFTCMLGPSANLMLAAIEHETNICVVSTTYSEEEINQQKTGDLLADARGNNIYSGEGIFSGTNEQGVRSI